MNAFRPWSRVHSFFRSPIDICWSPSMRPHYASRMTEFLTYHLDDLKITLTSTTPMECSTYTPRFLYHYERISLLSLSFVVDSTSPPRAEHCISLYTCDLDAGDELFRLRLGHWLVTLNLSLFPTTRTHAIPFLMYIYNFRFTLVSDIPS